MTSPKLAVDPLPRVIGPDGSDLSIGTLSAALRELRDVGYDAVHAAAARDDLLARPCFASGGTR